MLSEAADVAAHALRKRGEPDQRAEELARAVMLGLADVFGGRAFYLPRGLAVKRHFRDIDIAQRLTRDNARALAREYGITAIYVYECAKRGREALRKPQTEGNTE
ncbi:Mor transcription activator family protein [Aquimonas voraii]|uniref:Mor transcription activator family protein n=1 Tax=Aquimonas voraii TaxID=265719 RepID=UPI00159FB677|nr:Mor transcription activator family protein [Aquimonas voraii]